MMPVIWHEEAAREFAQAAIFYELRVEGLGERFTIQVEAALTKVRNSPLVFRCVEGECRKAGVDRFPYAVVYRVSAMGDLQILALAHFKKRPGYWKQRIEE